MAGLADSVALHAITDRFSVRMGTKYRQSLGLQEAQPPFNWTSDTIADCNHTLLRLQKQKTTDVLRPLVAVAEID